jgi:hypothetical protein
VRDRLGGLIPLICASAVACGGGGGFPDAPVKTPPPDPGTIAVTWSIEDSAGSAEPCAKANAAKVVMTIVQDGTGEQFGQTFMCSLGAAVTGSLPTASYHVGFSLYDGSNALLATGSGQMGVAVTPDHTTDVGQIVFAVQ